MDPIGIPSLKKRLGRLVNQIKDQNMTAIIFWLKYNHPSYGNRLELTAKIKNEHDELTDEQKAQIQQALKLGTLLDFSAKDNETKDKQGNK